MKKNKLFYPCLVVAIILNVGYGLFFGNFRIIFASSEPATTQPVTTTQNIYNNSRYEPYTPSLKNVIDIVGYSIKTDIQDALYIFKFLNPDSTLTDIDDTLKNVLENPDKGVDLTEAVKAQRVVDLKEYANRSTTGEIPDSYAFTCKRRILYPNGLYETDTMFIWYSDDTTLHTPDNLSGVQIGDFYLQPNTFVVFRSFSNGDNSCFYGNALDFPITWYNDGSTQWDVPVTSGKTYSVINQDGVVESVVPKSGYSYHPIISFRSAPSSSGSPPTYYNSITSDELYLIANNYPSRFTPYMSTDRVFTNIECMMSNAFDSQGVPMFGKGYIYNRVYRIENWYFSNGCYFGDKINTTNSIDLHFNYDSENIDPRKAPLYFNINDPINDPQIPTQQTVNNYNDYGITYNSDTDNFDLDVDALAAALGALIEPSLVPTFDGTFNSQPEIGLEFGTDLPLNMNTDFQLQLQDIFDNLPVPDGWQPPKYPAVNTSAYIPVTYPTIPTATYPQGYLESMGDTLSEGQDIFDTFGILGIIIPIVIFLVLWRILGGR